MSQKFIGVIPARFGATRFPGKSLALLNGVEMIAWVIRGVKTSKKLNQILIATDDERIAQVAKREGAMVAMTDSNLPSGTDRIWAAVQNVDCDVIINIQGDEPLIDGKLIDQLITAFEKDPSLKMGTLAHPISPEELESPHSVKVIVDSQNNAIYFSRFAIPYSKDNAKHAGGGQPKAALKHIGMYGYSKSFLKSFCAAPQAEIEVAESLEQLRALYLGAKIHVVQTEQKSWGVDTPEDLKKVEALMNARKMK